MTIGTDEEMIGRPIESRLKFKKNQKKIPDPSSKEKRS